ncbi:hypothetical protein RSOLAG22IIIB_11796 [Rhizoctonia solani]|uniref:BTB domain-containing protein n=1 Tax=Rhizoctonia solani TaxID=456999 RepID=A0A0K6GAX9_9AGAM|nr:hypothetical protein RSOLAG22IIIB_11796 [Rhizoctonia solani]
MLSKNQPSSRTPSTGTDVNKSVATKRHSKFYFDNTLVVIQVEDTLFNVHKYQLLKSETFADMFNMPKGTDGEQEGSSPENPIIMEGVAVTDFEALMTVLYARTSIDFGFSSYFSSDRPALESPLILPAFRLANMWNFSDLRGYLLPLVETALSDIDKIIFAREFDIQSWLAPAHRNLCERPEPITTEEARKLGVDSLLLISRMRELFRPPGIDNGQSSTYCQSCAAQASTKKPMTTKRSSNFYFEDSLLVIQVEYTLFKVHRYQLLKSETFSDMFKMPKDPNAGPEEGSSPEHPIVIEGVAAADFEALMTVLYASQFSSHQPTPEASLIIPAFRLANMWNFSDLRGYLLLLAERVLGDVDKIVFSREFDIQEWFALAHSNLCERPEPITTEEARKLGIDSLLVISRIREQFRPPNPANEPAKYYCTSCTSISYYNATRLCNSCHQSTSPSYLHKTDQHSGPTKMAITKNINQWIADGYVFKKQPLPFVPVPPSAPPSAPSSMSSRSSDSSDDDD